MAVFLQHALRAFFQRDVVLRRTDGRLRVLLEDRSVAPEDRPPSRAELRARRDADDLALAREQLATLLDGDGANLRPGLRHLAYVEHALGKHGFAALHQVPLDVLRQALAQLEQLVSNWSPVGLACLRSKMAVAVAERRDEQPDPESVRTSAMLEASSALAAQAIRTAKVAPGDDETAALRAAYEQLGVAAPPG